MSATEAGLNLSSFGSAAAATLGRAGISGNAAEASTVASRPALLVSVCAWCQKERGEQAQPNQSHGICDRHAAEMREELAWIKFLKQTVKEAA